MADLGTLKTTIFNSIDRIVIILIIIFLTFIVSRVVAFLLNRSFKKSSKIIKVDPTKYRFLKHTISALIYIIGISIAIYTIPSLRTLSVSIFAGAGVLAVIIGFASQQAFANIISGVFIVIFKPFRVGERVKLGPETFGVVEDITLRHTVIRNFENKRLIIPNSVISNETIENWDSTDEKICKWVEFGISYGSDIDTAIKIIQEEALKHPNFLDNRTDKEKKEGADPIPVRVIGFGDSSVNLRAYVWSKDPGASFVLGCDLNKSVKERFDREGVEIPFPYRTVVYKKDLEAEERKAGRQRRQRPKKRGNKR